MANYIRKKVRVWISNSNPPEQGSMWPVVLGTLGGSRVQVVVQERFTILSRHIICNLNPPEQGSLGQLCQDHWEGMYGQLYQEHVQGQDYKSKPS